MHVVGAAKIRIPKSEIRKKPESRNPKDKPAHEQFCVSGFVPRKLERSSEQRCDGVPFIRLAGNEIGGASVQFLESSLPKMVGGEGELC
jgi:hypothetical protein